LRGSIQLTTSSAEITIKQALAAAKRSVKVLTQPGHWHRRGHDWQHSLPVDANGQPLAFQKNSQATPPPWPGLEGSHRVVEPLRSPPSRKKCAQFSRQMRRHLFERMVLEQDFQVPARRAGSVQRRAFLGRVGRYVPPRSLAPNIRTVSLPAFVPQVTKPCGTGHGTAIPTRPFLQSSIQSSDSFASA